MWQNLIETLDKLGGVYDELAKLGEQKRAALVNVDMKKLSALLDQEKHFAIKIQELEQNRVVLLKNLSPSDINAPELYKTAPQPAQAKLFELHERLAENVQCTLKLRDDNQVLAQCALDAAQMQLNKLGGATVEPTYSGKGSDIVTHQKNFDFMA